MATRSRGGWRCSRRALVERVMDIARALERGWRRVRDGIESLIDRVFMSPLPWWLMGWVESWARAPERWWS